MTDVIFGIWCAHKEGQFILENNNNVCLNYVDTYYQPTEIYPLNPNGSKNGVAAVCSDNGRHMAMMPHPERSFLKWQIPYYGNLKEEWDEQIKNKYHYTPWFMIFKNAYEWLENLYL